MVNIWNRFMVDASPKADSDAVGAVIDTKSGRLPPWLLFAEQLPKNTSRRVPAFFVISRTLGSIRRYRQLATSSFHSHPTRRLAMADEKPTKSNWLKALGTSVFGLVSGAVLMYTTSFVNYFVKPKPLANFAYQAQGLEVTFSNRSTNANQGWWDFGDGSTLEPFSSDRETITHKYPRPGVYTAKLSLTNLFGDQNDRSVPVTLDDSQHGPSPAIEKFTVTSLKPDLTAPVTLRVESAVKNASLSIWSAGDVRPLEIMQDPAANQDRLVTFTEPGTYSIRLVAVNGKEAVEKTEKITVAKGNDSHARRFGREL